MTTAHWCFAFLFAVFATLAWQVHPVLTFVFAFCLWVVFHDGIRAWWKERK